MALYKSTFTKQRRQKDMQPQWPTRNAVLHAIDLLTVQIPVTWYFVGTVYKHCHQA